MKAYNNQEVIEAINSFSTESCILKGKQYDSEWTVNELLYCLESVASINNELYFSINTTDGMYIPCESGPYFVNSETRAQHVKICEIEPYDISPNEDGSKWVYVVIVEVQHK